MQSLEVQAKPGKLAFFSILMRFFLSTELSTNCDHLADYTELLTIKIFF